MLDAIHNIRLIIQRIPKLTQQTGGFLKVAVNEKNVLATGLHQAGHDGLVVAEIAREVNDPHVAVPPPEFPELIQRLVARAVIDKNNLKVAGNAGCRQDNLPVKLVQVLFGMVNRGDNR